MFMIQTSAPLTYNVVEVIHSLLPVGLHDLLRAIHVFVTENWLKAAHSHGVVATPTQRRRVVRAPVGRQDEARVAREPLLQHDSLCKLGIHCFESI